MYKSSLIYSLKIWIISIIVSPVIYYIWTNNYSEAFAMGNFFGFWAFTIMYGLILSSPCYALFLLVNFYVNSRKWRDVGKKIGLGLWATLLTLALFYLIFGHDDKIFLAYTIKLAMCYILAVICAIIYFRLPIRNPALDHVKQNS
jgi:hypothetical protein